jgi:hypothetical protein
MAALDQATDFLTRIDRHFYLEDHLHNYPTSTDSILHWVLEVRLHIGLANGHCDLTVLGCRQVRKIPESMT